MESMLPAERRQKILEIIGKELTVRVSSLSEALGVSEMTIRRDLDFLAERGLTERTHGGAVFCKRRTPGRFEYQSSVQSNPEERERIARAAAALIAPHDTVYFGEGASTAEMLQFIDPAIQCTIVTNNLGVISRYQGPPIELILLGGTYVKETNAVAGPITLEQIRLINANKVFLGVDGMSVRSGLTTPNLDIATIERNMIKQTRDEVIVMANHNKFGLVAEWIVAPIDQIDILITDRKVPAGFRKDLKQMGLKVIVADTSPDAAT